MPPNTHYLDWLNPHNADQYAPIESSAEEMAKSLELFTNSNFLDTEVLFPPFDASAFGTDLDETNNMLQAQNNEQTQRASSMTAPRNQRPQFQPIQARPSTEATDPGYMTQLSTASMGQVDSAYDSPLGQKRTAEQAEFTYGTTPASENGSDDLKSSNRGLDEEDKRRRNTAASARFRVKKKEREKALQQSAKSMMDKNAQLETRIKELEMENKWLRSLLKPVNAEQSKNVLASL